MTLFVAPRTPTVVFLMGTSGVLQDLVQVTGGPWAGGFYHRLQALHGLCSYRE